MVLIKSATTPVLPPLGPVALGLGPADRSLLPHQQHRKRFTHAVGCQTDTTELVELRQLQESLDEMRQELGGVNTELQHTELRLRAEVQEEYDERMRAFEKRTKDKVAYLKKRQEASVHAMRKALNAHLVNAKTQQEAELKRDHEHQSLQNSKEVVELRERLEQQALRIAAHQRENEELRAQLDKRSDSVPGKRGSVGAASSGADQQKVAMLEAQLASRDATIKALRDQLAGMQQAQLAAEASTPGKGGKKGKG